MREMPPTGSLTPENFRRVREVFEVALEYPAADRMAFVERECGTEPHVMNEVKRMLAADGQTHAIVDPPARASTAQGARQSSCASCGASLTASQRFCPGCGTPAGGEREGRFRAGALFANRFRIASALGRGGMGEVYRAHDLELGQPVALKFLTVLRSDERSRQRLRTEVRLARQLAHPNVCRVYDIGEANGELYLSMEYVDGEDLAALLKRIGRLPVDKGIEIARKLCAGLAAAHARGVLHRDLKPANIMIDAGGEVRVMDFGLAAVASELDAKDARSGTPAYMAPEQLAGREATVQSDLYALGLVLYELFTGKAPFAARDPNDLQRQRESHPSTAPSTLVPELGERVEQVILRCLEPDAKLRPTSALEVAAALPGGDPLAEALAAGETPSPDVVAASGPSYGLRPSIALGMLAAIAVTMSAALMLTARTQVAGGLTREFSPDVLAQRARELTRAFGHPVPADSVHGFLYERAGIGQDPFVSYWLREADEAVPRSLLHSPFLPGVGSAGRAQLIEPFGGPDVVSVNLDGTGRLLRFVGPSVGSVRADDQPVGHVDWPAAFAAAGLDMRRFSAVEPQLPPFGLADRRAAWTGVHPAHGEVPIRIEATGFADVITSFLVVFPWTTVEQPFPDRRPTGSSGAALVAVAAVFIGALIARHNWKTGRGDLRGAWRVAVFVSAGSLLFDVLGTDQDVFTLLFGTTLPFSVWYGALTATLYLALEPWLRRLWPEGLITWSRLLTGRWNDPVVGRDILVAVLAATTVAMLRILFLRTFGSSAEAGGEVLGLFPLENLMGGRFMAAAMLAPLMWGLIQAVFIFFIAAVARLLLRKAWLAGVVTWVLFSALISGMERNEWLFMSAMMTIGIPLALRFGFLFLMAWGGLGNLVDRSILTTDFDAWYGQSSLVAVVVVTVVAAWACRTTLGGRWQLPMTTQAR